MVALSVLALLVFSFDVSNQCALPYWWSQQYHMQPYEYFPPGGQPKTSFRYRSVFHRPDPNSYVHVQEYSSYTWYSSDDRPPPSPEDIRRMTNVVFSKHGFSTGDNAIDNAAGDKSHEGKAVPGSATRAESGRSLFPSVFSGPDADNNGLFSNFNPGSFWGGNSGVKGGVSGGNRGSFWGGNSGVKGGAAPGVKYDGVHPFANGLFLPAGSPGGHGMLLPGEATPSDTNGIVLPGESPDTNGIVPASEDTIEPLRDSGSNEVASGASPTTTQATTPATTTTTTTTRAPRTTRVRTTRTTTTTTTTTTSTTTAAPEEVSTSDDTSTTVVLPWPGNRERERNEDEVELLRPGVGGVGADPLERNELDESSSRIKVAKTLMTMDSPTSTEPSTSETSGTSFWGGWFGSKTSNETGPCQVSETDIHSLRSMIEKMFSSPRDHVMNPESKEKAREDILNKFRNFGLQVWTQNFTTPPLMNANGTEEADEGVNLIGVIPGAMRGSLDDEIVLVGAHYDTVPHSNGVDDNGSGLAVLLEVARAITEARCRLNHTLVFVAFDHEENGAMGSNHFVDHYLIPEELKRARARFQGAFILDGIMNYNSGPQSQDMPPDYSESLPGFQYFVNSSGNRGDFLALISRSELEDHLSGKLMGAWRDLPDDRYKLYNLVVDMGESAPEPHVIRSHANFLRSDHATFWYHNSTKHFPESLNAVLLTDTGPFRGQMKACYHSSCDDLSVITPEKLQFAKKTADALTAALVDLTSATASGVLVQASAVLFAVQMIFLFHVTKLLKQAA